MNLKPIFSLLFFNTDISLDTEVTDFKIVTQVKNIHMEGSMSQISYLGLSSYFMSKTGNFWSFFQTSFSKFHKIKTRT